MPFFYRENYKNRCIYLFDEVYPSFELYLNRLFTKLLMNLKSDVAKCFKPFNW